MLNTIHTLFPSITKGISVDTTADGKQVFLIIGDSKAAGSNNTGGPGPTPTANTVFQWNKNTSQIVQITNTDVLSIAAGQGSPWPQFGITYNSNSGFKPVFVPMAVAGSKFSQITDTNDWSTAGANYTPAITQCDACLTSLGLTKPKAILVRLGVNDIRNAAVLANIYTDMDSLVSRLTAKYPGVPIVFTMIGRNETTAFDARNYGVRGKLISIALNNPDVHIACIEASFISTGMMGADNLHDSLAMGNEVGRQMAEWFNNGAYSKWGRTIISSQYEVLTSNRKTLVDNFVTSQINSGRWNKLELLCFGKTNVKNSIYIDWSMFGYLFDVTSAGWVQNSHISTNGSTTRYGYTFVPGYNNSRASQNDFIIMTKLKTNNTASGVLATLFGSGNGTSIISIGQNATPNLTYRANDATLGLYTTEGVFIGGNWYGTGRNPDGGDANPRKFYKNSTIIKQDAIASVTPNTVIPSLGAFNNNGTFSSYINAEFECLFAAQYAGFDIAAFQTDVDTLLNNW